MPKVPKFFKKKIPDISKEFKRNTKLDLDINSTSNGYNTLNDFESKINHTQKTTNHFNNTTSHINRPPNSSTQSDSLYERIVHEMNVPEKDIHPGMNNRSEKKFADRKQKTQKKMEHRQMLRDVKAGDGILSPLLSTLGTSYNSAAHYFKQEGTVKGALIGTLQSGVTGGIASGGLAAIQGNDPWEAAKSGFMKGAVAGVGYQGLKAATHANTGSIWGNVKHMASTTKQTYQAHTRAGNVAMQRNGVSKQLQTVLNASALNKMNVASNNLYKKG